MLGTQSMVSSSGFSSPVQTLMGHWVDAEAPSPIPGKVERSLGRVCGG